MSAPRSPPVSSEPAMRVGPASGGRPPERKAATGEWLVADIGGTHARFACWTAAGGLALDTCRSYLNDHYADIGAVIQAYRLDVGSQATQAMLAVALPIGPKEPRPMTNRNWSLDPKVLRASNPLRRLRLVNDLVAAASGLETLCGTELEASGGHADETAPRVVVGVGTGLGAAFLLTGSERPRALASEAGHMTAAVEGADAASVRDRATRLYGRASWERLLSGAGLSLFDAVARGDESVEPPRDVAARARAGDTEALRAVDSFANALGQFAGDLALAVGGFGGVYFTGGVLMGLGPTLSLEALREGFEAKGRFCELLRSVPLTRVRAHDLATRGLDRLLAGAVEAPLFDT